MNYFEFSGASNQNYDFENILSLPSLSEVQNMQNITTANVPGYISGQSLPNINTNNLQVPQWNEEYGSNRDMTILPEVDCYGNELLLPFEDFQTISPQPTEISCTENWLVPSTDKGMEPASPPDEAPVFHELKSMNEFSNYENVTHNTANFVNYANKSYPFKPEYSSDGLFDTDAYDSSEISTEAPLYNFLSEDSSNNDSINLEDNLQSDDLYFDENVFNLAVPTSLETIKDYRVVSPEVTKFPSTKPPRKPRKGSLSDHETEEELPEANLRVWLKEIRVEGSSRTRGPRSYEFLLRMISDPSANPSLIVWEDQSEGIFRLIKKNLISKVWGQRKTKTKKNGISYDNFARNLRYHYKSRILLPVSEKHLVYRFGSPVMDKIRRGEMV